MEGKRIDEVFGEDFLKSNFWLCWRTMFAFEEWHSALEMKLYLHRFVHHIGGLPDFSALKFTKYNQYESLVLPLYRWLLDQGVNFEFDTEVVDVDVVRTPERRQATGIRWIRKGVEGGKVLGPDDLLFMTIGSLTENSDNGDHHTPAMLNEGPAPAGDLWRRIASKDPGDPGTGRDRREGGPGDAAVRDVVLHAAACGRPPGRRPRELGELRVHRPVRRKRPRLRLHHRVLRPDADGGGVPAARHRARRARGVQLHL